VLEVFEDDIIIDATSERMGSDNVMLCKDLILLLTAKQTHMWFAI